MRNYIENQQELGHGEVCRYRESRGAMGARGALGAGGGGGGAGGAGGGRALGVLEPVRRDPLRLALEAVDLVEQLLVGALRVVVDDDHVEQVPPAQLHVARRRYYLFQFFLLR